MVFLSEVLELLAVEYPGVLVKRYPSLDIHILISILLIVWISELQMLWGEAHGSPVTAGSLAV